MNIEFSLILNFLKNNMPKNGGQKICKLHSTHSTCIDVSDRYGSFVNKDSKCHQNDEIIANITFEPTSL